MAPSESARLALYTRLEEVIGLENANTLMTSLSEHDSDQTVTKADLAGLRTDIDLVRSDFERLEDRFDRLESKLDQHMRTYYLASVTSMTALTGIFGVIVAILR